MQNPLFITFDDTNTFAQQPEFDINNLDAPQNVQHVQSWQDTQTDTHSIDSSFDMTNDVPFINYTLHTHDLHSHAHSFHSDDSCGGDGSSDSCSYDGATDGYGVCDSHSVCTDANHDGVCDSHATSNDSNDYTDSSVSSETKSYDNPPKRYKIIKEY